MVSKQIPLALGYDKPDFWTSGFIELFSADNFLGNIENFNHHITRGAILITVSSFAVLIILQQPFAKKLKVIPAPLLVVVLGVIVNIIFTNVASDFSLKQTQLVNISSNIFENISFPDWKPCFVLKPLTN